MDPRGPIARISLKSRSCWISFQEKCISFRKKLISSKKKYSSFQKKLIAWQKKCISFHKNSTLGRNSRLMRANPKEIKEIPTIRKGAWGGLRGCQGPTYWGAWGGGAPQAFLFLAVGRVVGPWGKRLASGSWMQGAGQLPFRGRLP